MELQELIEKAWADRELLKSEEIQATIRKVVELLDKGQLRVAEPSADGDGWKVNEWIK
jgi:2,3,4,5-tetrahydropyridine-2-carboxylate N-succinyltransferase